MGQEKLLGLIKRYEELKQGFKDIEPELVEALTEIGIGEHFQDSETNAVYEVVEPAGTFISYKKISYNRTKLEGEVKGSLSMKRAKELGYEL